jgi:GNAT superfamily N-acetyltransferase
MSSAVIERVHGEFTISTDRSRLDIREVHRFLSEESYWATGRSFDLQVRAIENSAVVIGAYGPGPEHATRQVGFARMVTDLATFAWLADVFVLSSVRGSGLGTAMVETIVEHPDLAGVRRQLLATRDAHALYRKFGYAELPQPASFMLRMSGLA